MREILFRGWFECISGKSYWVYGYLNKQSNGNWEIINGEDNYTVSNVGQFTGLLDKRGKKIFAGDVCLSYGQDYMYKQIIEFHNTEKTCGRGWVGVNKMRSKDNGKTWDKINYFSYFSYPSTCEIIGNIYENKQTKK